jgi:hypothetical protein
MPQDKKISELSVASPLVGDELVPVVQSGQTKSVSTQEIANLASVEIQQSNIFIPKPRIFLKRDDFGQDDIIVNWLSADKTFLNYNPKIFLYRYSGNNKNYYEWDDDNIILVRKGKRGFKHPVHMNGVNSKYPKWDGGVSKDRFNNTISPRITEWDLQPESQFLNLNLNPLDWMSILNFGVSDKKQISYTRFKGNTRSARAVYFQIAIVIEKENVSSGEYPYLVGPSSQTFCFMLNRKGIERTPQDKYDSVSLKLL